MWAKINRSRRVALSELNFSKPAALGRAGPCRGAGQGHRCIVTLPWAAQRRPGSLVANPEKPNLVINNHNGIERWLQKGIVVPTELMEHPRGANALVLKQRVQDTACFQLTGTDALPVCREGFAGVRSTR